MIPAALILLPFLILDSIIVAMAASAVHDYRVRHMHPHG